MIGDRIAKVEKFLRKEGYEIRQKKNESVPDYMDRLYELEMKWKEDHQEHFPV